MFLLDTCSLLWLATDQSRIPKSTLDLIADPINPVFVSAGSALEIGIKHHKGKLQLPVDPEAWFERALKNYSLTVLPIDWQVAIRSSALPRLHQDPLDRIIVATAQHYGLTILTPDPVIHSYPGVQVSW